MCSSKIEHIIRIKNAIMDSVTITIQELLTILRYSTRNIEPTNSVEPGKRVASEFIVELNRRGHIDNKTLGQVMYAINPELRSQKVTVATRMVPYWYPEEMGSNGLMWRDRR
jgi:hypothetical protein